LAEDLVPGGTESEKLNVEYDKLTILLEKFPEFQLETEGVENQWKKDNHLENLSALKKIWNELKKLKDEDRIERFKKDPVLSLLSLSPDAILKQHEANWLILTAHDLNLLESRAVYAVLPVFKKEQTRQQQFVDGLQTKIEEMKKKKLEPVKPKPIERTKIVVIKAANPDQSSGDRGSLLDELMALRNKNKSKVPETTET